MNIINIFRGRRSKKQLLKFLLSNGEQYFCHGICDACMVLYLEDFLNFKEYRFFSEFIDKNRPQIGSPHFDPNMTQSNYYWPVGEWQPRKLWLEDQIKSL